MSAALEVLATGPQALVQDLGRVGLASIGVGRSGAADRAAYGLGNRMLGNPAGSASIEVVLGGLQVRARGSVTVCLTGAVAPARLDGRPVPYGAAVRLGDGQSLGLGLPPTGLRSYLAVRGGIAVPLVLGSRSTDTLSGVGPARLAVGDVLPVGTEASDLPDVDLAPYLEPTAGPVTLSVLPGPRLDWFADPRQLASLTWTVSPSSNRVGVRLEGGRLERTAQRSGDELPSEGMVRGCVQVPPSGEPVIFLNDHPISGGYPVVAVVCTPDVDHAAQVRPGQGVRFRWSTSRWLTSRWLTAETSSKAR